jgi:hypothetical protein
MSSETVRAGPVRLLGYEDSCAAFEASQGHRLRKRRNSIDRVTIFYSFKAIERLIQSQPYFGSSQFDDRYSIRTSLFLLILRVNG